MRIFWLTFAGILLLALNSAAQEDTVYIHPSWDGLNWEQFVAQLEDQHGLAFFYHPDSLKDQTMEVEGEKVALMKILNRNLSPKGFRVYTDGRGNYFYYKHLRLQTALAGDFFQPPKRSPRTTARGDTSVDQQKGSQ